MGSNLEKSFLLELQGKPFKVLSRQNRFVIANASIAEIRRKIAEK